MKIDHIVLNINPKYQTDNSIIEEIRKTGLLYKPENGKGTSGFKASNIWIGNEYFEMINILKPDGGGWVHKWTNLYNKGHRGMICLMLDVDNIESLYKNIKGKGIEISEPEWLEIKLFLNLFTKRMPWRNSYLPFFSEVPLQIGFQQLKDEKTRNFMNQRMNPNSIENGIKGIREITIFGKFSDYDFNLLNIVFEHKAEEEGNRIKVLLNSNQKVIFEKSDNYNVIVKTESNYNKSTVIENIKIMC